MTKTNFKTIAQFEKEQHEKRVDHFAGYVANHQHVNATIQMVMDMFGITREQATPIYEQGKAKGMFG